MDNLIILDSERIYFPSSNSFLASLYKFLEDKHLKIIYKFFIIPKVKKYAKKGNTRIISTDKETETILKENNIPFSIVDNYVNKSDYDIYEKKSIEFIRNLPKLVPEVDIKYEDTSLWKVDESDIHKSFFRPLITNIEIINKVISVEKPKCLVILDSKSKLGMIQKQFNHNIKVMDKTCLLSKIKKQILHLFTPFAVKTIHSDFIKKIKLAKYKPKKTKEIVFLGSERGSYYFYNLLEKFKKNLTILQTEEFGKKVDGFIYDFIEDYINQKSKDRLRLFKFGLKRKSRDLKKSKKFKNNFKYKNIYLFDLLEEMFTYLFTMGYLHSAFYCECFKNLFNEKKPKLIIITCESPKHHKVILSFSKKYSIKSLFLMHGAFGIDYLYSNLLSDKVAVYGEYYKNMLIKLGNDKGKLVVTGNPSWDYLTKSKFNRKEILSKLKLSTEDKIILLATTHFPIRVRNRLIYSAIKAMIKLPNYHLVIKLHPEEKPDFYKKLLKRYNLKATIIEDLSMLHPLIYVSELVIISNSTVGLETLILDKPLIDVNIITTPEEVDYITTKTALSVRKEEELLPAIKSILEDKKVRDEPRKNRKKYVYEHAYKQDGKAAERVADLIEKMLV